MDMNGMKQQRPAAPVPHNVPHAGRKRSRTLGMVAFGIAGLVLALVIIIGGVVFAQKTQLSAGQVKKDQYQAVFLTNNQVYFGKVKSINDESVVISDVYYLQVQQSVQPDAKDKTADQQQLSLAKLGGELHGPEDTMFLNRDQVLFWENLKNDSKVVQAIQNNNK